MDLVSLTRFQSLSKDLYKLKDQGIDAIQIKVRGQGSNNENYITLFDENTTPSSPPFTSPILDHFPSYPTKSTIPLTQSQYNFLTTQTPHKILHPISPPPPPHLTKTPVSKLLKLLAHAWRGFSIGFTIKALFNFLPKIIKQGPAAFLRAFSPLQLVNPTRYGLFASSFLAIFHGIMLLTKHSQDFSLQARSFISSTIAAFLSTTTFLPRGDRTGLAIFFFVRAFETICRTAVEANIFPAIPHADSLLFGISTAHIVFAWVFCPWALDKGYVGFLNNHTGNRAQGTQQSLAFLHVNAPKDVYSGTSGSVNNPVSSDPSAPPVSFDLSSANSLLDYGMTSEFNETGEMIRIPGSYSDGLRYGYTKVKNWDKGLDIQQTIDYYAKKHPEGLKNDKSGLLQATGVVNKDSNITHNAPSNINTIPTSSTSILQTPLSSLLTTPSLKLPTSLHPSTILPTTTPSSFLHSPLPSHSREINPIIPLTILANAPAHHRPTESSLLPEELVKCCNAWHKHRHQEPLLPQNLTDRSKLICNILHPYAPNYCIGGQLLAYPGVLKQGVKTYLPVYLLPALIFRYNTLLKDPKSWLQHTALSTLQSAAFFSNMTFLAHTFSCYWRHFFNNFNSPLAYHYYLMPGLTGLAAFCAILLEQKSKRIELALFSFSHAIRVVLNVSLRNRTLPVIPWANSALFAVSVAILITTAMTNPTLLRPSYFSLLRYFLGRETPGLTSVVPNKHHSSHSSSQNTQNQKPTNTLTVNPFAQSPTLVAEFTPLSAHADFQQQFPNYQDQLNSSGNPQNLNATSEPILSTTSTLRPLVNPLKQQHHGSQSMQLDGTSQSHTSDSLHSLNLSTQSATIPNRANHGQHQGQRQNQSQNQSQSQNASSNNKSDWMQEVLVQDLVLNANQPDTSTKLPPTMKHVDSHVLFSAPLTPVVGPQSSQDSQSTGQ